MSRVSIGVRGTQSGFSLLEVLISSVIFSYGLAGFASLLLNSMAGASEARLEGVAAREASNLAELIRLNPASLQRYLEPVDHISAFCDGNTACTPAQQADYDLRLWQTGLADRIRNARGLVCQDGTPQDGGEGNAQCDGSGPLVIKVFWPGHRKDKDNQVQRYRYVLEVS